MLYPFSDELVAETVAYSSSSHRPRSNLESDWFPPVTSSGVPHALSPQVLSNIDELFDRREFSAAPDPGWPDCFNSGVFVFQPSLETHSLLLQHATDHGSFDGTLRGSWAFVDRTGAVATPLTHRTSSPPPRTCE